MAARIRGAARCRKARYSVNVGLPVFDEPSGHAEDINKKHNPPGLRRRQTGYQRTTVKRVASTDELAAAWILRLR